MAYCGHCGVEVEERMHRCPLCEGALQAERPPAVGVYPETPEVPDLPPMSWAERRLVVLNMVSVLLFSALLAVLFVDVFTDYKVSWSLHCLPALAAAWCYASLCLHLYRHPWLLNIGLTMVTGLMLALLDLANGRLEWFTTLAFPILCGSFVLVGGVLTMARQPRSSWALTLAVGLAAITVFCVLLDSYLRWRLGQGPWPSWSLAVFISLLPAELFFLYVHVWLRKRVNLGKVFHL
jgi:hypothetical protein